VREAYREKLEGCNLNIMSFEEVIALGNKGKNKDIPFSPPTPEHVGLIMYTSGSTGKPKVRRERREINKNKNKLQYFDVMNHTITFSVCLCFSYCEKCCCCCCC
jgi:acyl-CoA synthetase (AMP-forming)/AMP-acid ligase II